MLVDADKAREKLAKVCDELLEAFCDCGVRIPEAIRQADLSDCAVESQAAEIERLKEDAGRYRWLRDKSRPNGVCPFYLSVVEAFKDTIFKPETVDAQIDSAKGSSSGVRAKSAWRPMHQKSDSPRTDAALAVGSVPFEAQEQILITQVVPAAFARQLETEVAALTTERDELTRRLADACSHANQSLLSRTQNAEAELDAAKRALAEMEQRKDAAYLERNQVVAALAKCFNSGTGRTAIEGWSEDWHGCVYIDLPTGQVSWHYHDSHGYLFAALPLYHGGWDGHSTEEKYRRLAALAAKSTEQPMNCKEAGPGRGQCDKCAAGYYEKCRYAAKSAKQGG